MNVGKCLDGSNDDQLPTTIEKLQALGFDNEHQYAEHQRVMNASNELAKNQLATSFDVYAGYVQLDGTHIKVEFQASINATQAEKDSAFVTALSQVATLNYLCIGTV